MPQIDEKWKLWIWKNVERGCDKDHIFKALLDRGFGWENIRAELGHEPTQDLHGLDVPMVARGAEVTDRSLAAIERREVVKGLWELRDVLSPHECGVLIEGARHHLHRSTVVADSSQAGEAGEAESEFRTSQAAHFERDAVVGAEFDAVHRRLRRLVAELTGLPEQNQEPIQILYYGVGGKFEAHHDDFEPDSEYLTWERQRGGQRLFSFMAYLNDTIAGGGTDYPELGITVEPHLGKAVFWPNVDDAGRRNPSSLHASRPVAAGEKWVLVCWIREACFGEGLADPPEEKGLDHWLARLPSIEPPEWIVTETAAQQERIPYLGAGGPECRGFEKRFLDPEIYREVLAMYEAVRSELRPEKGDAIGTFLGTTRRDFPPALFGEVREFNALLLALLKPIHEEWCGFPLDPSSCYGFRVYLDGAFLHPHVDVPKTHVISSTLCVAHDVHAPWLIEGEDVDGRPFAVDIEPGELLLYESARIKHGRPVPLNGRSHVGMFIHYQPAIDHDLWAVSPHDWKRKHRP